MNSARFNCFRRAAAFLPSAAFIVTIVIVAATTTAAQTNVFVPGNASGCFGNPYDECVPLVAALSVSGPATITVTYVSGLVSWEGPNNTTGPNGTTCGANCQGHQTPLSEAFGVGLNGAQVNNIAALIGAFVPQARVQFKGFNPLDGTKDVTDVGILPNRLFFIGTGRTVSVSEAGTLYLGINDMIVGDNGGGFNVTVSAQ